MARIPVYSFLLLAIFLMTISPLASGQNAATSLIGTSLSPCINISFAGDTTSQKFENNKANSSPVKTVVYPDGHEKISIEDGVFKGLLGLEAEYPRFFPAGTQFKITNVILGKKDLELTLTPVPTGSDVGAVKLEIGAGYSTKTAEELMAQINQMLRVGSASCNVPQKTQSTALPVTLDCSTKETISNYGLSEVVFDEASQSATFEKVGSSRAMQPAVITDAEIKWNDGIPGPSRMFYSLSRSTGVLLAYRAGTNLYSIHYDCSVRAKKF
jgi:hypothetical protein